MSFIDLLILGVDWETALYGFVSDQRIGDSHLNVQGHDGKLGFGGTCFPKDINAFISFAKKNNINMNVLEAATNLSKTRKRLGKFKRKSSIR